VSGTVERGGVFSRAASQLKERVAKTGSSDQRRTAVLVVNGYDRHSKNPFHEDEARRFPWIRLCLEQLARHTPESRYEVFAWDNSALPEHLDILRSDPHVTLFSDEDGNDVRHGRALDRLLRQVPPDVEFVVTLDTDSFPIRDGWLENLTGRLDRGARLAGVWRDEMAPRIPAYVHPSCLAVRRDTLVELNVDFARKQGHRVDVGQHITNSVIAAGGLIGRLRRSNTHNMHFLMGGVYGDLVYHHGAGSRHASFWTSFDTSADEAVRTALRDAAFRDLDGLIDFLTGNGPLEQPPPAAPQPDGE
jgi:Glycosyl transferase family 2